MILPSKESLLRHVRKNVPTPVCDVVRAAQYVRMSTEHQQYSIDNQNAAIQDIDEAAHYEFLCKNLGAAVHHCAEQFANDGTLPRSVLKFLKRMADCRLQPRIGCKTFAGKTRPALLGFRWVELRATDCDAG
jgi:hypothetical protein